MTTKSKLSSRQIRMLSLDEITKEKLAAKEAHWSVAGYHLFVRDQWERIYMNCAGGLADLATLRCMVAELESRVRGVQTDNDKQVFMEELHDQTIISLDFEKRKREKLERELQKGVEKDKKPT